MLRSTYLYVILAMIVAVIELSSVIVAVVLSCGDTGNSGTVSIQYSCSDSPIWPQLLMLSLLETMRIRHGCFLVPVCSYSDGTLSACHI